MRWFFRLLLLLILLVPIGCIGALFLCIERTPTVQSDARLSVTNIERAKRLLQEHDPRSLEAGEVKTVSVDQEELSVILLHMINRLGPAGVSVEMAQGALNVVASVDLSKAIAARYINLDMSIVETTGRAEIGHLQVGQLRLPSNIANYVVSQLVRYVSRSVDMDDLAEVIRNVEIHPQRVDLTYRWEPGIIDAMRETMITEEDRAILRSYAGILSSEVVRHADTESYANLLSAIFERVRQRSLESDPVVENRAAIIVLASYASGRSLTSLVPDAKNWPKPLRVAFRLHGRTDFVQHFATSAALAATGGSVIADAIGLYKEVDDADGGSGFSFKDLAADKAGKRFGEIAVISPAAAHQLQSQVADGVNDNVLIPNVAGLEEKLNNLEFRRRYGGVGGDKYKLVVADIEQRIRASPLYR